MIFGGFFATCLAFFVVELGQADKIGNFLEFDFLRLPSPQLVCRPGNWVESVYGIYKEVFHTHVTG